MIIIADEVYKILEQYNEYLIKEGLTTKERANQKVDLILQALNKNLGGIRRFPFSQYKSFGASQNHRLYVYKDTKSKTQWGFTHQEFNDGSGNINVIIYNMKNMKLVTEGFTNKYRQK